jgi:hypothetical protein
MAQESRWPGEQVMAEAGAERLQERLAAGVSHRSLLIPAQTAPRRSLLRWVHPPAVSARGRGARSAAAGPASPSPRARDRAQHRDEQHRAHRRASSVSMSCQWAQSPARRHHDVGFHLGRTAPAGVHPPWRLPRRCSPAAVGREHRHRHQLRRGISIERLQERHQLVDLLWLQPYAQLVPAHQLDRLLQRRHRAVVKVGRAEGEG